jgi:transcription antitermination protein NusB
MLSRRQLRSKCLQALYAYSQSQNTSMAAGEKELMHSITKIYELYLFLLIVIPEVSDLASKKIEERKQKILPKQEDLNPNTKFIGNELIAKLKQNRALNKALSNYKTNWSNDSDFIRKVYQEITSSHEYEKYMANPEKSFEQDKELIIGIYKKFIAGSEELEQLFEEKSIYWMNDIELVDSMVVKTFKSFTKESDEQHPILDLYNDEQEDKEFVIDLFRKSILNSDSYEEMISDKTQNWEIERIALMDVLIMKMAVCEILNFPSIPVKVTLNEYIEISKWYSTPKSKLFVNGILDKIIADLKAQNKIKKSGRGLME